MLLVATPYITRMDSRWPVGFPRRPAPREGNVMLWKSTQQKFWEAQTAGGEGSSSARFEHSTGMTVIRADSFAEALAPLWCQIET